MTGKTITVFYHANCLDGLGAAAGMQYFHGEKIKFIPINYGDVYPEVMDTDVYFVDFAPTPEKALELAAFNHSVTIIDHHLTAVEKFKGIELPENLKTIFDTTHSGAYLVWQTLCGYVPPLVVHIEDRDLWLWQKVGTAEICATLFARDLSVQDMFELCVDELSVKTMYTQGCAILLANNQHVKRMAKECFWLDLGEMPKEPIFVNATVLTSEVCNAILEEIPEDECEGQVAVALKLNPDGTWSGSVRSNDGKSAKIFAEKFGGGGHPNAAGCSFPEKTF